MVEERTQDSMPGAAPVAVVFCDRCPLEARALIISVVLCFFVRV